MDTRADAAVAQERAKECAASEEVVSRSERWRNARPSKAMLVWCCIGAIALTMLIGFQWGGWQTAKGAAAIASSAANAAVVERLAPICVAQSNLDPEREDKLVAMQDISSYQQAAYVAEQ